MEGRMRPTIEEYYVDMLRLVASRATCVRRQVGAIITDVNGQVLSTGYNGVPSGIKHCIDTPCGGAFDIPGDTRRCMAVHAEMNALLQCGGNITRANTIYCSAFPCFMCAKMICNTRIVRVIYLDEYQDIQGRDLFTQRHISFKQYIPAYFSKP